jgi:hypothetical protein
MTVSYINNHQVFPDTQLYLGWTYRLMGYDAATAEWMVRAYIERHADFTPYESLWGPSILELTYRPRMLLPLLSVPFVWLFGPGGMVVVPGIAFVMAVYFMYRFAAIHARVPAAVAATLLVVASPVVLTWGIGALTDSLALMLHAAMFLLLPWRRRADWRMVTGIAAICAVAATARIITPYTITAAVGLWLWARLRGDRVQRRSWTAVTIGAFVGSLIGLVWMRWTTSPLTMMSTLTAVTAGDVRTYDDLLPWYVSNVPGRLAAEGHHIADNWALLLLVIVSLAACVTARRSVVPWLVIPAWVGAIGLFLLNPIVTVFRLQLPILPALVVGAAVAIDQAPRLADAVLQRRRSSGKEEQPTDLRHEDGAEPLPPPSERIDNAQASRGEPTPFASAIHVLAQISSPGRTRSRSSSSGSSRSRRGLPQPS